MKLGWEPLFHSLLLLLALTLPGDGNEGSVTGSCQCDFIMPSTSTPWPKFMERSRKHLKAYNRCPFYIRFQLTSRNVCGGIRDPWVRELMSCFDRGECGSGIGHSESLVNQEHLPFPSTSIPEPTKGAPPDMSTPAQMYLPRTQQSTQQFRLPSGVPKELIHLTETTAPTAGYIVGTGSKAGQNLRLQEGTASTATGKSAMVPVLSLLAIVFILSAVLTGVLCKRRRDQSLQYSPDMQLHYTPVTPDSNV